MADNDMKATLRIEVDATSASKTKKTVADINKTVKQLEGEVKKLDRADALKNLGRSFGEQAGKVEDSRKAVSDLAREITELGATEREIAKVAQEFAKAEQNARALQKTVSDVDGGRVKGALGIVSPEVAGTVNAIEDVKKAFGELEGVSLGTVASLGALGLGLAAVGVAFDLFQQEMQRQADVVNARVEAFRRIEEEIAQGLTVEEATQRIESYNRSLEAQQGVLQSLEGAYDEATRSLGVVGTAIAQVASGAEQALAEQIEKQRELVAELETSVRDYEKALASGRLATDDATQSETDLAREREEATRATMEAIEAERKKRDAEREAQRKAQDAEREAQRQAQEIERRAEQVAQANRRYAQSLQQIASATADAIDDLITRTRRTVADNQRKLADDLASQQRASQDKLREQNIKALERERDAYRNHARDLERIRNRSLSDERDAIEARDFALVAQLRERAKEEVDEAQKAFEQRLSDEAQAQRDATNAQQRALADQRRDRLIAYQQQRRDLRNNLIAEVNDARTSHNRRLRDAQVAYQNERSQFAQHLQARVAMQNQILGGGASGGGGGMARAGGGGGGAILGGSGMAQVYQNYMRGLQRAVDSMNNRQITNNFNIRSNNPQSSANETVRILQQTGLG